MTIPAGLFIDSPEMNDVSLQKLNQDPNNWPEEIVEKIKERVPQTSGMNIVIKFMKKDEENGAATGSATISSPTKIAIIPVIIKDFFLSPLDVMMVDNKLLPLTGDYFMAAFQGDTNNAFLRLEEFPMYSGLHRFEDASLWQANYPPGQGRYAYASAGYEILDKISTHIDTSEFKDYLQKNPEVVANFAKHGQLEIIEKLAKHVNMSEFTQSKNNLLPGITMLRLEGPNKYSILSNTDTTFNPAASAYVNRSELKKLLAHVCDHVDDMVNELDQSGEKLLMPLFVKDQTNPLAGQIESQRENQDTVESADEFGPYKVMKKDGVKVEGFVIPVVISFDMKVMKEKIFIGKTMSTIQHDIAGVRMSGTHYKPFKPDVPPMVGQTGTFVYKPDHNKALATMPVTVRAVEEDGGDLNIKAIDLLGQRVNLRLCCQSGFPVAPQPDGKNGGQIFDGFQRIAKTMDGYVLPRKFFWVPMEGFQEISSNVVDYATKIAAMEHETDCVTLVPTGYNQYSLKGADKYAAHMDWDKTNLASWQAKFLMANLGIGEEKIAHAIKVAGRVGHAKVAVKIRPQFGIDTLNKRACAWMNIREYTEKIKSNLTKEASFMDNAQTVDALLSLNFINPDNINKFVGFLPRLKATISNLCSLVLASRLGMQEIPEQATSSALYRLIDVVNGLEKLRAIQESGANQQ